MKFLTGLLVSVAITIFVGSSAQAYEVKQVCAKYKTDYNWSRGQATKVRIYRGDEMNKVIGSYSKFNMFDHYAVVFWEDGGVPSLIKLNSYFAGSMMLNQRGEDQYGRDWQLSDNTLGMCY